MRVKCLAQEHNTMSLARARTRTARSGVERTNHEAPNNDNDNDDNNNNIYPGSPLALTVFSGAL